MPRHPGVLVAAAVAMLLAMPLAGSAGAPSHGANPSAAAAALPLGVEGRLASTAVEDPSAAEGVSTPQVDGGPTSASTPAFVLRVPASNSSADISNARFLMTNSSTRFPGDPFPGPQPSHPMAMSASEANLSVPEVQDTLMLGNGSILSGDAVPPPTDGEYTAYDPQTHLIYLSDGSDTILKVDPSRSSVVGAFNVSGAAGNMLFDAAKGWLLVESDQEVLAVWPTNGTLAASIAAPDASSGMDGTMVLDPVEDTLWVTNPFSSDVSIVNLASASLQTQRGVGEGFNDILSGVYDPVNGEVYLSYYENGTVEVFNASSFVRLRDVNLGAFCCFTWGLGVDPVSGNVYVTDGLATFWSDYVEINGTTNSVAGSVGVGVFPSNSVYDPTTGMMYLVDAYTSRIFVIDPTNLTVMDRIPITQDAPLLAGQDYPTDLQDLGEVVVAVQYGNTLDTISISNNSQLSTIHFHSDPGSGLHDPACGCIVVTDFFRDQLYFIDPVTLNINASVDLPGEPVGIAYDNRTTTLWVSLGGFFYADGIDVLNASTGASIGRLGGSWLPGGITYDPTSDRMFVSDVFDNEVRAFDATTLTQIAVVTVGTFPSAILYVPSTGDVYVANSGGSNLSIINGTNDSSIGSWTVSGGPTVLGYDRATGTLLVGNDTPSGLEVLNVANGTVTGALAIPYVSGFSDDTSTGQLIVFNGSPSIAFVNVSSLSFATTIVGEYVTSGVWAPGIGLLANDPEVGAVYLLTTGGSGLLANLTVHIDPEIASPGDPVTITLTFSGGVQPVTLAFSGLPTGCTPTSNSSFRCLPPVPGQYRVEVKARDGVGRTSGASALLWVDRTYPVEVAATGLPAGTLWSFLLFGEFTGSTATSEISAPVLNGTYLFVITAGGPYLPTRGRGFVAVSGAPVSLKVEFLRAYNVTFNEEGLPPGSGWNVTLRGLTRSSSGTTLEFLEPNGTMAYTAESTWYTAPSGTVVVEGGPVNVVLPFSPKEFPVTFLASGLPAGTAWTVTVSSGEGSITSLQPSITFNLTNGSYSYSVSTNSTTFRPNSQVISFNLPGYGITFDVQFWRVYPVVFSETGLTPEEWWGVISDFSEANSTTSQLTLYLPNGSWYVWAQPPVGYVGNPSSEYVTVEGAGLLSSIAFSLAPGWYPVTFTETGLPNGAVWGLVFDWQQVSTNSTSLFAPAPNGSIPFLVLPPRGYAAQPASGSVQVNGGPVSVDLTFFVAPSYTVKFTETGIPSKALAKDGWTVVLNGSREWSTATTISFTGLGTGTYPVLVTGPSGYVQAPGPATHVTVSGATSRTLVFGKGRTATLTYTEKGLPKGQAWCVELDDDAQQCSTTSSLTYLNLSPYDYDYAVVSPLGGQNITLRVGEFVTRGSVGVVYLTGSATVGLTFAYDYAVTFTQTGLTVGSWSVTIKGHTETAAWDQTIQFNLTNGTYAYKIGTVTGHRSVGSPSKVTVNGAATSVKVMFAKKS